MSYEQGDTAKKFGLEQESLIRIRLDNVAKANKFGFLRQALELRM
jgi:hypothetical protein